RTADEGRKRVVEAGRDLLPAELPQGLLEPAEPAIELLVRLLRTLAATASLLQQLGELRLGVEEPLPHALADVGGHRRAMQRSHDRTQIAGDAVETCGRRVCALAVGADIGGARIAVVAVERRTGSSNDVEPEGRTRPDQLARARERR